MKTTTDNMSHRKVHLFLAIAGMTGIAGLFLPFTAGVSPFSAAFRNFLWIECVPFLLTIPITGACIYLISRGPLPKVGKVIAYTFSLASAFGTVYIIYTGIVNWTSGMIELVWIIIPLFVFISGGWLIINKIIKGSAREYCPIMVLQFTYLANCLLCLVEYWPSGGDFIHFGWEIGAWFSLATAIIYLLQIYLFATQKNELSLQGQEAETSI